MIDLGMTSGIDLGKTSANRFRSRCMFSELNSTDAAWIQMCIDAFIRTFPMDLKWPHASRHILAHAWLWDVFTDDGHSDS